MGEVILRRIGDSSYVEPTSPRKVIELKIEPPTVIGRGPILRCPDKKVSRNHATIDWDDDGILITSTHTNPTFVIINGKEKTLSQGQSAVLNNEDKFGLFKGTYWYKVILKSVHSNLVKNLTAKQESNPLPEDIQGGDVSSLNNKEEEEVANANNNSEKDDDLQNKPTVDLSEKSTLDSNKIENDIVMTKEESDDENIPEIFSSFNNRERELPKWLRNSKAGISSEEVAAKDKGKLHGDNRKKVRAPKPPKEKPKPKKKLHESSDDSEYEEKISPKKTTKKQNKAAKKPNQYHSLSQDFDTPEFDTEIPEKNKVANKPVESVASRKGLHSVSDEDEDISPSKNRNKEQKTLAKVGVRKSDDDSKISDGEMKKGAKVPRKSCEYGEQCYRKTSKHRKEMAHPGDADYVSHDDVSSADEDDDKPECEYGVNCYRKNPQHRKSFKHTKVIQPARNAKRKAEQEGYNDNDDDDDDSENEYDFDDPFLNDDSSDDYAPTDSDGPDSDIEDAVKEDDTQRMLKEAKKFVKKRKH